MTASHLHAHGATTADAAHATPAIQGVVASVVVVTWNGAALLDECLRALRAQTIADRIEVIVVENGSTDGTLGVLARHGAEIVGPGSALTPRPPFPGRGRGGDEGHVSASGAHPAPSRARGAGDEGTPWLRAVLNGRNLGFATGCNQGIRLARGPYVALLNNDAVPEPTWLAELVAALERLPADAGAATSRVLAYDDRATLDNVGHVLFADGLTRGRGRGERDRGQYARVEEVFCASGCAALFKRAMLDDVAVPGDGGSFDDAFFAYCDDADLGFRARLRGWRCFYVPSAVAYHRFSASTAAFSPLKALNVERNRAWLAVRNLPLPLLVASPLFTLARYGWQGYGALSGRGASGKFAEAASKGALAGILLRAYWEALRGLPRALRARRHIQARRRATTRDVLRWLRRYGIGAREIALME